MLVVKISIFAFWSLNLLSMPQNSENSNVLNYSQKEILEELDIILSSESFSRSSVLSNFLKFIVEETLEGNTDGLKEYTIAVGALGKSDDFNPQIDAIVRIHAGRLRRLLNEYYTTSGTSDSIKIELVKGSYVPVFRAHLISSPSLEISDSKKPKSFSRSKLTIAVLPFRNLCPDNDYEFFVEGLGEELTRLFSKFQDIDVIAHHSTRRYATQPEDIRVIGSDLGVHYVITGSVKRSPKEIRVNVALIRTLNGQQVWSQTYNNPLNIDNLLDIQDQIIENVCSVLGGYYGIIIHDGSKSSNENLTSMDSFDAALWNYYFNINYSEETYLKTREALENALVQNPNYPIGLAMLAELYVLAYTLGYPTVDDPVNVGLELTKKAIKIDPNCQRAYQEYAWALMNLKRKEEAIQAMEKCLSINPSSVSSMGTIGFGMACVGEYDRALVLLTQSIDLNPHCPWWFYYGFFLVYYHKRDYIKALEYANKIETVDVYLDPLTKAIAKAQLGMYEDAQKDVRLLNENFPAIINNLTETLETFMLDKSMIEQIIEGAKKAGLKEI